MRLRGNVILQFSLATFLVVAIVSAALGFIITSAIGEYEIRSHITLYPEIIRLALRDPGDLYADLRSPTIRPPSARTESLLREFLGLGKIFRVKLWNPKATIVWSDQKNLIGMRFEDDDAFNIAIGGTVTYELGSAEKTENIDERDRGVTLQIYTPLFDGATVVGVLEFYETDRDLFADIAKNTISIWLLVVAAGIAIYLLLFFIFYTSHEVQKRAQIELEETQDVTIFALAYQAELRDRETGKHLERTSLYVRILAEELSRLPQFRQYLSPRYIEDLVKSAPLHDIGKVGVPDAVLLKPGKLSPQEWEMMKRHCEFGAQVLHRAQRKLKFQSFLTIAVQLTIGHHEKWNGTGYPQGLAGERIPISARIMALADVYDALRSRRVYKESMPHSDCAEIIRNERGEHFDPDVVDAFLRRETEFARVSEELADGADYLDEPEVLL